MNKKTLLLLVVVLAILGGASLLLLRRESTAWQAGKTAADGKVLGEFDLNAVARIDIKSSGGEVTVVGKDGEWVVAQRGEYPADFGRVADLIRKLWSLEAVQDVAANASQLGQLELAEPAGDKENTGTLIDLKDASGQRIAAILLGKMHMRSGGGGPMGGGEFPAGRYVMAADGNRVALVSEPFSEAEWQAKDWLNKEFIRVGNLKSIALKSAEPPGEWTLSRGEENGPWELAESKRALDTVKVQAIAGALQNLSFDNVLPADADPAASGLENPGTLTLKTFDGFTYVWSIGKLQENNYPVRISVSAELPKERAATANEKAADKEKLDQEFAEKRQALEAKLEEEKRFEGRIYLVPQHVLASVLVPRQELLAPAPEEAKSEE